MKDSVSLVLVGAGGMGSCYLKALFEGFSSSEILLRGVVEPRPEQSFSYTELLERKISIFPSLFDYHEKNPPADLVIIAAPVHHHVNLSCQALQRGSYVLCEKPLAATVQDAQRLISETDSSDLWVKIGYQWSFSEAIQRLKKDIFQGRFGRPLRLKTLCLWPRDLIYFKRNDWAGKKKDKEGHWVLDSPANNAMAHFLHNVFYVLGDLPESSALPMEVMAELYRAYPIENFDTIACRVLTEGGVEILFFASHSTLDELGPMFSFEFEKAMVSFGESRDTIVALTHDGEVTNYGSPEKDPFRKLFDAVSAVHTILPVTCGPDAAYSQTLCLNGIQDSLSNICAFPESKVLKDKNRIWVDGLVEELYGCYKRGILPSESGISWACRGKSVDLCNYGFFPGGAPSLGE
jgi:predicted dehydrogenase